MTEFLVHATNLRKSFGHIPAVDGVSLQVKAGEIYGLVGSDGAGKTTTMRLLVGALKPDEGEITICGYDMRKQTEQGRAQIGYLSQRFSLYEDLTVLENIRFFAEVRGLSKDEWLPRCLEILHFVGLDQFQHRLAGQLSGGMKQKLGLATALVTRPRLLLLDEPTTGVDPVTRQDFWQLIIKLVAPSAEENADHEVSVIISTPYMDEASRCHRIGFMKAGRIIAEDTPSNLRARLNGQILELRGQPLGTLRHVAHAHSSVEDVAAFGDRLHLRVRPGTASQVLSDLPEAIRAAGAELLELRPIPAVLEDVFIALSEANHE
ncbi:MAG: ATP-binding cassette domain-containing protein [Anaerolineae bacterium]